MSYAREDADAVRRIADALRAFGVEVWFDQNELRGGDVWDQKIRTQIRTCTLCVPVVSATTQARGEGYFRREWRIAVERTHDMAAGVPFLLPVVIDDTAEAGALVPDEFMRVQWTRLPKGVPTPQFVEQVKRLLSKEPGAWSREMEAGRPRPVERGGDTPPPKKKSAVVLTSGTVAVIVAIAVAIGVFRKAEPATPPPAAAAKPAAPAPPVFSDKSIAVLPFTNMSEDKDSGFFADGVHEDILTNLALVRELRVVSRTSVMPYRTTAKSMRQIAQELGVTYILEGSVRRSGNKVRVTGQLIHAATDEHVWAQAYDRDLTDVFTIQAELSQQIAAALKTVLSPEEKVLIARKPTENPAAYDLFLRARDILNREGNGFSSRKKQIALLQSAVELDPTFAQAWGALAESRAFWAFSDFEEADTELAQAKVAIDRAVQLAPDDPEVYSNLGTYYYYGYRDYARAVEQYERRARLQPNSPSVFNSLALIQRRQGQWAQSLPNARRACELDPSNLRYLRNMAATLRAGRRWDELLATQGRIVALSPGDLDEAYQLVYFQFLATGSTRAAEQFFAGLSPSVRDSVLGVNLRKQWASTVGDYAEVVRLDRLQPYYDGDGTPHREQAYFTAFNYYAMGDQAGAKARLGDFPGEMRAISERMPRNVRVLEFLGGMEALLGHKEEALHYVEKAVELRPVTSDALDGGTAEAVRAIVYDLMGEKEKALAEYTRLFRTPLIQLVSVQEFKRQYSTLKGDPRFEALLNDPANNAPLF
ncbi:MAG: TIR domain-containing protein [Lacunisphaera sp.]